MTFPAHPPLGGGQVRVFNLYRELARSMDVELVTLAPPGGGVRRTQLAPGLWETRVPKSAAHAAAEAQLEAGAGTVVTDVAMYRLYSETPEYLARLAAASDGAAAVVACHPYTVAAIRQVTDAPLWYEAQDVEALLKAGLLTGPAQATRALLDDVNECEGLCCREAQLIWACSREDGDELVRRYDVEPEKVLIVPNGAALDQLSYTPPRERQERKRRLRLEDRFMAAFIASWHQPNILAAEHLLESAAKRPAIDFLILGSVGQALGGRAVPSNVQLMGPVPDGLKQAVLGVVDAALNPVTTGSGTNIKMLDYLGSGVPVISTTFGARGLGVSPGVHYLAAEPQDFPAALDGLRALGLSELDALASSARRQIEETLSWSAIAAELRSQIQELVGVRLAA